jgi:hypothetical protein
MHDMHAQMEERAARCGGRNTTPQNLELQCCPDFDDLQLAHFHFTQDGQTPNWVAGKNRSRSAYSELTGLQPPEGAHHVR